GTGLMWAFMTEGPEKVSVRFFFFCCVAVAGLTSGAVVSKKFYLFQAFPAAFALLLIVWRDGLLSFY
ncbi:MAG: DUF1304 family protein, partial [Deltaproteobacteria bacterium]|nr:DUF1304 family protein [Deltaproteobacteria bacterium]